MITGKPYRYLICMMFLAGFVSGCNDTGHQQQLSKIVEELKAASSNLREGQVTKAKINGMGNQILVVINSGYAGSIKPSKLISEQLVRETLLDYSASETGETFLLLIDNGKIVASSGVPGAVLQTSMEPFLNNAKVAVSGEQVAYLTCIKAEDAPVKQKWDYWSQNCKTVQLIKFAKE